VDDGVGTEHAGRDIGDRHAETGWAAVGFSRYAHQPRHALHDQVVRRPIARRSLLAESRDQTVDDARTSLFDGLVAEAETVDRAGAEVFDDDVGKLDQLPEDLLARLALEIERQAALIAVDAQVVGAD